MFSSPLTILVAAHWTHSSMPMSFLSWRAWYWMLYPREVSQMPSRGNYHFPWPAGCTNAAQADASLLWSKAVLLLHMNLSTWTFRSFSAELLLREFAADSLGCEESFHPRCRNFHLLPEVPVSPSLQPVQVLWRAALPSSMLTSPPSFVLSASLLRGHSVPLSKSIMKTLHSTDPSTDSRGTPVVADLLGRLSVNRYYWNPACA